MNDDNDNDECYIKWMHNNFKENLKLNMWY